MMTMRLEGFYGSIVTTFFSVIKGLLFEGKKNPAPFEKSLLVKNNNESSSFWLVETILSLGKSIRPDVLSNSYRYCLLY